MSTYERAQKTLSDLNETTAGGESLLVQLREINKWLNEYLPRLRSQTPAREAVERHKL